MRRFRSLAAYQIHCSPNTGEFEARVQIQFGLLDLELLTKWMSATLLSQAADCSPRFLHTTSSFNHCWVPVSWIVCVSTAATHSHTLCVKHTKDTVVLLNPQLAMTSSQSKILSNCPKVSTVIIKTKATYIFTYFRNRGSYDQIKNICAFCFGANYNQTLIKVEPGS